MASESLLQKRMQKIKQFFDSPYNILFVGILLFSIILRIYYFSKTFTQPVWWDEAEYLLMAKAWAFGSEYTFLPVRPVLFSFISAGFMTLSTSEILPRLLILLFSIGSIWGMYHLGKEFYNEKVGLLSMFLMSIFYLNLFFSVRLLVELPSLTCFIFGVFYFWKYLKNNADTKSLYLAATILAIGTLFRLLTAAVFFAILIYLFITERLSFIKKKELWKAGILYTIILSPYLIWGYLEFGGFVISQAGAWNSPQGNFFGNGFNLMFAYFSLFNTYMSLPILLMLIGGCISFYGIFVGFDLLKYNKEVQLRKELFLFLIFIIPLLIVSFSLGHTENRYILNSFPAIFIICSSLIILIYEKIAKNAKVLAMIFVIGILLFSFNFQLQNSKNLIDSKINSYAQVKLAGEWIGENSQEGDVVLSLSWPQVWYYSGRETIRTPRTEEEFNLLLQERDDIRFFTVSIFENHEPWIYEYPAKANLTLINAYFLDPGRTRPGFVIYSLE